MVREFSYRGEVFRATVHGRPGKEEIFLIHMTEDDEEGPEISLDRFEDPGNDPTQSLESGLAALADKLFTEQGMVPADGNAPFAWAEAKGSARVHNGVQHHDHA
jgi:hypothetical protein